MPEEELEPTEDDQAEQAESADPDVAVDLTPLSPAADLESRPLSTSDAALTFREARLLTGRRGGRLVMLMGETGAGKTTLMVETWTHLIASGPLGNHHFAGSRTAIAFEERAYLSRLTAGRGEGDTRRTQPEDDGLLHLRITRPDGRRLELLLADYAGEHFERIREGVVDLITELPWAGRADRVAVLLDGYAIGQGGGERELTFNRAMRQVLALREAGIFPPTSRLALILVKDDQHDQENLDEANVRLEALINTARQVDPDAELIRLAARPADGSAPVGLDLFVDWMCRDDRVAPTRTFRVPEPQRAIARIRR